jgi:hypothetical protein
MFYVYNLNGVPVIYNEDKHNNDLLIDKSDSFEGAQSICDNFILPEEGEIRSDISLQLILRGRHQK